MFSILKKRIFYIRVYSDRIKIRYLGGNKDLDRISIRKFSNKRMVLADFTAFEHFLKGLVDELLNNKSKWFTENTFVFQVMEKTGDGLSDVELRAYRDSGIHARGTIIKIYTKTDELSDNRIREIINSDEYS